MMLAAEPRPTIPTAIRYVWCWSRPMCRSGTCPPCSLSSGWCEPGEIVERALREWWGIARPRVAVCAVNPHAGESGLFGDEEERVLRPAAESWEPLARCRRIRCSSGPCGASSTRCWRPITTSG